MVEYLCGMGLGLIFKGKGSTGGSDLLVNLIKSFSHLFNTSNILITIDIIIISINLLAFREIEIGLYSTIAILVSGKMIDIIFEGINFSKTLYIISDKTDEIAEKIMEEIAVRSYGFVWKGTLSKCEKNSYNVCLQKKKCNINQKYFVRN